VRGVDDPKQRFGGVGRDRQHADVSMTIRSARNRAADRFGDRCRRRGGVAASPRATPACARRPCCRDRSRGARAPRRGASCRCRSSRRRTTHVVDPLPERVRLVNAPGDLLDRELEVLGWTTDGDETALICRLADGSAGTCRRAGRTCRGASSRGRRSARWSRRRDGGCCWSVATGCAGGVRDA
jgi:hypothetical protein